MMPDAKDTPTTKPPLPPCHPGVPPASVEEDEINLLDLLIVLLKYKVMIVCLVLLAGIGALVASLQMTNIYRSECTLSPTVQERAGASGAASALSALGGIGGMVASEMGIGGTGNLEQFSVVLKSRELTNRIVQQYDLMPVIFEKAWDARNKRWTVEKPPTLQDAYNAVQGMLVATADKKQNIMRLSFDHKDPKTAATLLNYYVVGLSEFLRRQTLEDAAAQQLHLSQQLVKTTDPLLKNRLYELIARQIEKETLAKVQRYYSFNVMDPAFVPEKKFKPKRAQICLLSVVVAFFVSVFLVFFLEYLRNLKAKEDPVRLANLRSALRLRRKS